jgi:hypothetical protein
MSRLSGALALIFTLAAVWLAVPTTASAQQPGQGPPLPMAMDLKKVPVGSWAEYSMVAGQMPPMKMRMALVGRGPATHTLEMTMEGGMVAMAGGKVVMQSVIDSDQSKESLVKKLFLQIADNDPMEMHVDAAQQKQFQKPDPKSFVKDETIQVPAGSFKTKHYRNKTAKGDVFDIWVSPSVPPFGLVKLEAEQKQGAAAGQGAAKFELTAVGKDATMRITKPAKPMDQALLMKQIMGGAGMAAPPAGGPPPAAPRKN